jgi:uncharacterized membrane protein YbhN (UPF0104 family)
VSGLVGLAVVSRQAMSDDQSATPALAALVAAAVVYAGAGVAAAHGWATLLVPHVSAPDARGAMYASQLSKYVPGGGLLQAAGQVGLAAQDRATVRRGAIAWGSAMVITVAVGAAIVGAFALAGAVDGTARAIAVPGLLALFAIDRRGMSWVLARARRVIKRIPEPDLLPAQSALWRAAAWTTASQLLNAACFTILLTDLHPSTSAAEAMPAYVAGWLVGFLVVPLPGGVGVREAVLLALLPGTPAGVLVSASLWQRVLAFGVEALLLTGHRLLRRRAAGRPA